MTEIEALVREKMVRVLFFSWSLPSSAVCKPSDLSCWRVCFRRLSFQFFFYYLATGESRAHGETRSLQWPPSIDALFGTHALGATLIVLREWLKLVVIILADGLAPGLFAPKYCTTGC